MADKKTAPTADAEQQRKRRMLRRTALGAATTAAGALALFGRGPEIAPIPLDPPPASAPEIPPLPQTGQMAEPTHINPIEREDATPAPPALTALQMRPEQFKYIRLNLRQAGSDIVLEAVLQEEKERNIYYQPAASYLSIRKNEDIRKLVEQARVDARNRIRAKKPSTPKTAIYIKKYSDVPNTPTVELARVQPGGKILLKVGLDQDAGNWLNNALKMPVELTQQIDNVFYSGNEIVAFLQNINIAQDKAAYETLVRIFAMDDDTRSALKQALSKQDIGRAAIIIDTMSALPNIPPAIESITLDLFQAVKNYGKKAIDLGLSESGARVVLKRASLSEIPYDENENPLHRKNSITLLAGQAIRQAMSREQFDILKDLPEQIRELLANATIPDKGKPAQEYSEFMYKITSDAILNFHAPMATLQLLQSYTDQLFSMSGKPGWLDSQDSTFNMPSLLSLMASIDASEKIRKIPQTLQRRQLPGTGNSLTMVIPTDDLEAANKLLARTGILMQAASSNQLLLESDGVKHDEPLAIRLKNASATAVELRDPNTNHAEAVQPELLPSLTTLLFPLTDSPALDAETAKALENMTKVSDVGGIQIYTPAGAHATNVQTGREGAGTRGR